MKNKIILATFFVILVISISRGLSEVDPNKNIRVGFIGALTGVDPEYGLSIKNGVSLAVEEINYRGGIDGRKLEVIYEDGECIDAPKAISAAHKLVDVDKMSIILDGSCSTGLLAYAPFAEENKVLVISSGATSDAVSESGEYIFRNVPKTSVAGNIIAKTAIKQYSRAAIISENTDYSGVFRESFVSKYTELGGMIVADEQVLSGRTDFRTELLKIRNQKPDFIVVNPQSASAVPQIIKQAREMGMKEIAVYFAYFSTPDVIEAGDFMNGTTLVDLPSDLQESYLKKYVDKYSIEPQYRFSSALGYDAVYILVRAIEETNSTDPTILKSYLDNAVSFTGVTGDVHFDINGDIVGIPHIMKIIQNGKLVTVGDLIY